MRIYNPKSFLLSVNVSLYLNYCFDSRGIFTFCDHIHHLLRRFLNIAKLYLFMTKFESKYNSQWMLSHVLCAPPDWVDFNWFSIRIVYMSCRNFSINPNRIRWLMMVICLSMRKCYAEDQLMNGKIIRNGTAANGMLRRQQLNEEISVSLNQNEPNIVE